MNRPAGWYDEATGQLFLATKSFGRALAGNYDKALTKANEHHDYEAPTANMVASRQTYGADFFDQTMASNYTGNEQRTLSEEEFSNALIQKDARDTLSMLSGLGELQAELKKA